MLQLVASKTGNHGNIIYIGHSLATTLALMYGSENAQEAKAMVKLFILLSPSYKLTNMKSPYRYIRSMLMQMRVSLHTYKAYFTSDNENRFENTTNNT